MFLFFGYFEFSKSKQNLNTTSTVEQVEPKPTAKSLRNPEVVLTSLREIIGAEDAIFGIEIYELETGRRYGINETQQFHAASVGKLIVAVYCLNQVDQGKVSLDKIIDSVSLRERLRLTVNQSDNGSWESLLNFFGYAKIHAYEKSLGLANSDVNKNTSTAADTNSLLHKIYKGEVLKEESKNLLFKFMQNTEREERIPRGVPKGTILYHKAGTYNGETHDTGIIIHPRQPFAITIFSQAKYDTTFALQKITKTVYDFFSGD